MKTQIQIKLFSGLDAYIPPSADSFPIEPGITVRSLLERIRIPPEKVRLVFIDSVKKDLDSMLYGGERVSLFPPIGGG